MWRLGERKREVQSFEGKTAVLVELGLTVSEARVYLALVQMGVSRIGSVSEVTGIHRANLYSTLSSLENKCLIEKEINSPATYKAASPEITLPMLVKRKQTQVFELKTKAEAMAVSLSSKQSWMDAVKESGKEKAMFVVVPGREVIVNRLKRLLQESQVSVDVVTTQKRFSSAILDFAKDYKKALDRGVKIRITIEKNLMDQAAIDMVRMLAANPSFEVKCLSSAADAVVSIIDEQQATVMMSSVAHLDGTSALWSNNECFVAIVKNYFESKWSSTVKLQI
ncbi:MAG: hypothetical protein NWF00_09480 [Candidatus Bathyarchaeota archaeon]|nr:hypothetical protein [Candidatus Bathyarchaeota archaeon]